MHLAELIPTAATDPAILDRLETFLTTTLGKGVVRAKDTPELHREPDRHLRDAGHDHRGGEVRAGLRRGRRPDRRQDGPRQVGHLPHRGRRRPGHDGPRDQHDAGHAQGRRLRGDLPDAAGAQGADRQGRARPEDRRRLLPEGRQGHPAAGPGQGRLRAGRRQGRRDRRAHPEEEGPGRAAAAAARLQQPAGPVRLVDPARLVPLRGRVPRADRRQRARRGLRDALGFRHGRGAVRSLAAGRLAAGGAVDQGRHRRRQGAGQGAAAQAWVFEGKVAERGGVHHGRRLVFAGARRVRAALDAARVQPPAASARRFAARARPAGTPPAPRCTRTTRSRLWTLDGRGVDDVLVLSIKTKMHAIGPGVIEGLLKGVALAEQRLQGPGDLVARRAVLGRRRPAGDAAGCSCRAA